MNIFFNLLQLVGGIILAFGYIPQIVKTFRTKSVKDLSTTYYIGIVIGVALMELYAIYNLIHGIAIMFFITNTISLVMCVTMLILTITYREKKEGK